MEGEIYSGSRVEAARKAAQREKRLAYLREYNKKKLADPEARQKKREQNKLYNDTHPEVVRQAQRKYYESHREEINAKAKASKALKKVQTIAT